MRIRRITSHPSTRSTKRLDAQPKHPDHEGGSASTVRAEKRYLGTLKALADADRGRTLEHKEIEAWVDSLERRRGASGR